MTHVRRLLRHVVMDIGPLRRHRDFRLLFFGQLVTFLGSMLTFVAIPYQVYALTGSSLTVGLLSLAELVPVLMLGLVGGALADVIDRRRLVLVTELAFMVMSAALAWNATLTRSVRRAHLRRGGGLGRLLVAAAAGARRAAATPRRAR